MRSRSAPVNSRTVTWYVSVPRSALPSPAAVRLRYQSGVGGCSCLGGEDVDDVRLGVVREVHHRGDVRPPACAAAVMHQDQRGALEVPADPALVRPELRDGLRVPVERLAHVELLSFTVPGYALGPGDGRSRRPFSAITPLTWYFLVAGAGFEPATSGL